MAAAQADAPEGISSLAAARHARDAAAMNRRRELPAKWMAVAAGIALFLVGIPILLSVAGNSDADNTANVDTSTDTFTKLHDFSGATDGSSPSGMVVSGTTVFGTANHGGANGDGTIWSFDIGTNTFTNLYSFNVPEPSTVTLAAMCGLTLLIHHTRRLCEPCQ